MFVCGSLPGLRLVCGVVVLACGFLVGAAEAQVAPSARESVHSLWVGAEYSNIQAGFPYQSNQRLWGIGGFADYALRSHIGIAAETHFLRFNSFYGETEDNYLAGPRYSPRTFGKIEPYVQCLAGLGKIQYPFSIGNDSYLAVAPGAGVRYRLASRWLVRAEYEYQFWLNSPGFSNEPEDQITPNGLHVGLAFRLSR